MPEFKLTDPLVRAWLKNRVEAFVPRVKKLKATKAKPYTWSLRELAADMQRTLDELNDRIDTLGL